VFCAFPDSLRRWIPKEILHPSFTYSEGSKEEDEFAEEVKKHKSILKSHFSDRVGMESSPGYTTGVPQNQVSSILQDMLSTLQD